MNYTNHIEGVVCVTDGNFPADSFVFSGPRLPEVGEKVNVSMNGLGMATVIGYKPYPGQTAMFVALVVVFDNPPAWYVNQNGKDEPGPVFGREIDWEENNA